MNTLEKISLYNPKSKRKRNRPRWRVGTKEIVKRGAEQTENRKCWGYAREMRRNPTNGEQAFSGILRKMHISQQVKRQCVMFGYILDFFWAKKFLAFEIDGPSHEKTQEYDAKRTERLSLQNISVVRFTNEEVSKTPGEVIRRIRAIAKRKKRPIKTQPVKEFKAEHFSQEFLESLIQ